MNDNNLIVATLTGKPIWNVSPLGHFLGKSKKATETLLIREDLISLPISIGKVRVESYLLDDIPEYYCYIVDIVLTKPTADLEGFTAILVVDGNTGFIKKYTNFRKVESYLTEQELDTTEIKTLKFIESYMEGENLKS